MAKFLDQNGLLYLWQKIVNKFVAKETGKGLSTNDFTTDLKNKLDGIAAGAQVNVKPDWNASAGNAAEILNKPTIPSKTSDLQNDSGFITEAQVPEGAVASNTTPTMNGTAAVGTETAFARGDHVHPSDTSKADVNHNHDDTYLKLSGGTMTGPIVFAEGQGQIAVSDETAEAKVEVDSEATEILFKSKTTNKTNRMTVSASAAEIVVGETSPGDGSGVKITVDETNGVKIPNLVAPTNDRDAATKKYVDDGLATKAASNHNHDDVYAKKDETYSKTDIDGKGFLVAADIANKADKATTLAGYGITNAYTKDEVYTKTEVDGKGFLVASDIANKADKATTLAGYGITDAFTKDEINSKLSSVYKPGGSLNFADLPEPSEAILGLVYSMNDAFTTDDRFLASEPVQYPIGTNVVTIAVSDGGETRYLFDVLAGFVDLSDYAKKTDMVAITNQEIDEIVA